MHAPPIGPHGCFWQTLRRCVPTKTKNISAPSRFAPIIRVSCAISVFFFFSHFFVDNSESNPQHAPRASLHHFLLYSINTAPFSVHLWSLVYARWRMTLRCNMAFVTPAPLGFSQQRLPTRFTPRRLSLRIRRAPLASSSDSDTAKNFKIPQPRYFIPRPDRALDVLTSGAGLALRLGAGALVEGYRVKNENGNFVEYSSTLPVVQPKLPLRLFEFEACPFCRKVREAVTMLDLDVLVFPCPKNGKLYREYVKRKGGKSQFPYLEDPNTGFEAYESDDIIRYLYKTYGPASGVVPPVIGRASTLSAGLAQVLRQGRGGKRASKTVPIKKPIELYGHEASPFTKIVRETLCELELPYYLHTTARGSRSRAELKERVGRFQAPYIIDPNTGVAMFESAEICEYLMKVYGPNARTAAVSPTDGSVFMPGDSIEEEELKEEGKVDTSLDPKLEKDKVEALMDLKSEKEKAEKAKKAVDPQTEKDDVENSIDPQGEKDKVLEEYCKQNPESGECRVYED